LFLTSGEPLLRRHILFRVFIVTLLRLSPKHYERVAVLLMENLFI